MHYHQDTLSSFFQKCVTLETGGSRLPQREEDVAHDGGTADTRGSDDAKDVVHIVTQVLLKQSGIPRLTPSPQRLYPPHTNTHHPTTRPPPLTLFVSRFSDSLSLTGSISQGLCSVQICGESQNYRNLHVRREPFELSRSAVTYLIYDGLERDLQIVHPRQFHCLINALGGQRVSSENGVRIPTQRRGTCVITQRLS